MESCIDCTVAASRLSTMPADACIRPHMFEQYTEQFVCPLRCAAFKSQQFDKQSTDSLLLGILSFFDTLPIFVGFVLARIVAHSKNPQSTQRFLIEFTLIVTPAVVFLTLGTFYSILYTTIVSFYLIIFTYRNCIWTKAKKRQHFELGKRPAVLTLLRATAYLGTSIVILAIDFPKVPQIYHKSRQYGASLMDIGIGLFVLTMGMVSKRARCTKDILHLKSSVGPLLFLGLARTIILSAINYHQDEYEYGVHLNAFFTLGFVKLFGTIISAAAMCDMQLVPLSLGLIALHEILLQCGISNFVMNDYVPRDTFVRANREGICSLPGFVALYLLSISFNSWLREKSTLSYIEIRRKLLQMLLVALICWLLVVVNAYTVGISRVTCNFGYVAWVFAIVQTLSAMYLLFFEVIINTALPVNDGASKHKSLTGSFQDNTYLKSDKILTNKADLSSVPVAPTLADALNFNGLTFFLVSNVFTGCVNMILNPSERSLLETLIILLSYALLATGCVYVLYRKRIRIA